MISGLKLKLTGIAVDVLTGFIFGYAKYGLKRVED